MASTINASTSPAAIVQTADGTGILALQTGNTTAVTINASQNVGVGTTSPQVSLQVNGVIRAATADDKGVIGVGESGGGTTSNCGLWRGDANSAISGGVVSTGGNYLNLGGYAGMVFTTGAAAIGSQTERMRINSSGNVLVGITSTTSFTQTGTLYIGDSGTVDPIQIYRNSTGSSGQIGFNNPNGRVGEIYTSGSSTVYATSSDYRLKENIVPMTGALDTVQALKPVTYKWKVDGSDGQGFIAHELQEVVPDCVSEKKDAVDAEGNPIYQGVDTSFLVATLTAAIQELAKASSEQQTIINDLTARIETLEAK
jgi:hypothetical protein